MTYRRFKYEAALYALAFLIAIFVRLVQLGALPLTDAEAAPALQALRISQGQDPALSPHPLYILATSVMFLLYGGGTNFLARIIPALVGGILVLAPLLFDDRFKPRPSLLLAFFLALDPGLVAISRQAASPILAIAFLAFTAGFINKGKPTLAAVTAALALLSGPSVWLGLLILVVTLAFARFFLPKPAEETVEEKTSSISLPLSSYFIPFVLALFLGGTLFFSVPGGIGASFSAIPTFIGSWRSASDTTQQMIFLSLLLYQPFALLLSIVAIIRGWSRGLRRIIFLSVWLLISLLFIIFYPARQMADLAWALIPLNALASLELARHITVYPDERREVAGVVLLTLFIWVFAWLGMSGINFLPIASPDYTLRVWMLVGSLLLLFVSLVLVAAGWSIRIARIGGIWGLAIGLGVMSLGGMFGSTGLRGLNAPEMWWLPGIPSQAELVRDTVSEVSDIGRGNDHIASVVILGIESPALEWTLRENPVQVSDALDDTDSPDIVITPFESNLASLESAYRGQDFIWRRTPIWAYADGPTWFRWVSLREIPQSQEYIILWAKSDLFLDE